MHWAVLLIILVALTLFMVGKPRYDIVSLLSLLALVAVGALNVEEAFMGFSHGAVITVAAVLVISTGLLKTGYIDQLILLFNKKLSSIPKQLFALMGITAFLSSFMNNVGALALVMPITMSIAKQSKNSPSIYLMPVAAASLLGGLITKIGTPPNLLISSFREQMDLPGYQLFDFAPIGLFITLVCITYIALWGWRWIPQRTSAISSEDPYRIEEYISEVIVPSQSIYVGKSLKELLEKSQVDIIVLSILRNGNRILAPVAQERLEANDLLVVKGEHAEFNNLIDKTDLRLKHIHPTLLKAETSLENLEMSLVEVILKAESPLISKTVVELDMRNTLAVNLVALSRKGSDAVYRLKDYTFQAGDVLLIQVKKSKLPSVCQRIGAIALTHRDANFRSPLPQWKKIACVSSFILAVLVNGFDLMPIQISFLCAALFQVLLGILSPKEMYDSIEWPIIAMLGSLIPMGIALETSGAASMLADFLFRFAQNQPPIIALGVIMTITLLLTNLINNSAAAVMMAPIGIALAVQLELSVDPFLMGVCIAASSAYMTPIGHQSNTLIMGPGGYRFTDYWQLGLPISIATIVLGAPAIAYMWPF